MSYKFNKSDGVIFQQDSGNFGIGTSVDPTAKLHVDGSIRLDGLATTAVAGYVLQATDANGNTDWVDPNSLLTAGNGGIYGGNGSLGGTTAVTMGANDLTFQGNNVTFNNTTSNHTIHQQNLSTASNIFTGTLYESYNTSSAVAIGGSILCKFLSKGPTTILGELQFYTSAGGSGNLQRMVITSSGDVSIGNTAPTFGHTLTVENTFDAASDSIVNVVSGNTGESIVYFSDSDALGLGAIRYDHSNNAMNITVNASTRLTVDSNGDLGVGNTSPGARLHVEGVGTGTTLGFLVENSSGTDAMVIQDDTKVGFMVTPSSLTGVSDINIGISKWMQFDSPNNSDVWGGIKFQEAAASFANYGGKVFYGGNSGDKIMYFTVQSAGTIDGGIGVERGTGRVSVFQGTSSHDPTNDFDVAGNGKFSEYLQTGGRRVKIHSYSASATIDDNHEVITITEGRASFTITFPAAPTDGQKFTVLSISSFPTFSVEISANGKSWRHLDGTTSDPAFSTWGSRTWMYLTSTWYEIR